VDLLVREIYPKYGQGELTEKEIEMKPFKMLGWGVLTALLAIVLGGSSLAMAEGTELCKTDEIPCKNPITFVHEVTQEEKRAALLTNLGNVECNVLFSGEVLSDTTNGPAFVSGNFTYTTCLFKGAACEVKEVSKSSSLTILKEAHETGTAKLKGEFSVKCGFSINCTFSEESLAGVAKGALLSTLANGEVSINGAAIKKITGVICPKEAKLDMTTSPLTKTFLAQGNAYCVRYENSRGRWLLGPSSTACQKNEGVQSFNYEMIWSRTAGLTTGAMLCVWDEGLTFYLTRTSGTVCGNKDEPNPEGKFELAEVA
jgi:hypothetical protein